MTIGAWIGVILAGLAFVAGMVGHICYSVWWASRINTTLEFVQKTLLEIATDMKAHKINGVTKEDLAREVTRLDEKVNGAFKRIDETRKKTDEHTTKLEEHKLEFEYLKKGLVKGEQL